MNKRVALLGACAVPLMAAVAATGSQVELSSPGYARFQKGRTTKREKATQSRIRKQWYTVDSPEVKRMSKG